MYNFYHTLNDAGLPDTLFIDPFMNYNLVVHTLPPVTKENISLNHGKHNIIAVNAPQGYLNLVIKGITQYKNLIAVVKKAGGTETVYAQEFNTLQKIWSGGMIWRFLACRGFTLKMLKSSKVQQQPLKLSNQVKYIIYSSTPMIGSIFRTVNGKLEWVTNLDDKLLTQVLIMQPGTYILSYRRKNARSTFYTNDKEFVVSSGTSLSINLK
jgi:Ca-activated chloride channel family protein